MATYEVVSMIAAGGMAEVHLAREYRPHGVSRVVAIKRMRPALADDPELRAMFLDEARLWMQLDHPHVLGVLALVDIDGRPSIVLPRVHGADLATLLRGGPFPMPIVAAVGLGIAEAMAYVHGVCDELGEPLGIVHRDLTPSNVLVGQHGGVLLTDFGIARSSMASWKTRTGVIKGSPGYMAPEQLAGAAEIDGRADVFALGAILQELATGVPVFGDDRGANAVPRAAAAPADTALGALVSRCLARNPDDRPATMAEVADALREVLATQGGPPSLRDIGRFVSRRAPDIDDTVVVPPPHQTAQATDPAASSSASVPSPPPSARWSRWTLPIAVVALVFVVGLVAFAIGRLLSG